MFTFFICTIFISLYIKASTQERLCGTGYQNIIDDNKNTNDR